jgi:hypothetical protein
MYESRRVQFGTEGVEKRSPPVNLVIYCAGFYLLSFFIASIASYAKFHFLKILISSRFFPPRLEPFYHFMKGTLS